MHSGAVRAARRGAHNLTPSKQKMRDTGVFVLRYFGLASVLSVDTLSASLLRQRSCFTTIRFCFKSVKRQTLQKPIKTMHFEMIHYITCHPWLTLWAVRRLLIKRRACVSCITSSDQVSGTFFFFYTIKKKAMTQQVGKVHLTFIKNWLRKLTACQHVRLLVSSKSHTLELNAW